MRPQPAAGVNSHFDDGDMRAKAQMQLAGKALRDECKNPQFLALEYRPRASPTGVIFRCKSCQGCGGKKAKAESDW